MADETLRTLKSGKSLIVLYEHGRRGLLHRYPIDSIICVNRPPGFVTIEDPENRLIATYNIHAITAIRGDE